MPETRAYETRDVSVLGVGLFALGLVVSLCLIGLITAGLYQLFEAAHPLLGSPSRIEIHPRMIAPPPRLESNPAVDFEEFRAAEDAKLNSYGWVDTDAGIVRIPIERAMDLIVQRGLPTRGPGTQNSSDKTPEDMVKERANKK